MLSSRRKHDGREEQLSQKQFPTKDHQPHRYNRSSFPCSTPSYNSLAPTLSTMASSSSSEFTSYSNFPSSPDSTGNCSESDDTSRESALLLYQAFVADESASCNSRSKQSTEYLRQGNNGKVVQDPSNNGGGEQSQLPSNDGASKKSNSLSKEANDLGSSGGIGYGSSNNENNKQHSTIPNREGLRRNKDNSNDDDASANSKSSEPSHHSQTEITSFISRHRRKIGSLMFTLTSLWMYSKFKQKNHRDRRHQLQCGSICNHDLIQRKILSIYKVLLQLLSRLRVSSLIQRMASPRITEASASGASLVHASTTPLSHLLAVAKAGNVSKVMLRGSVISYLHSIQSAAPVSSAQTKLQRWSTTTLPSKNENFVQEILSTLMNNGCDDITTLPESLWQRFLNGPALVIFPFTYLGALYWIMRRLQKQQLENEGNENKFNRTASMQHTTTFDDVAGIDSALQELSEVVAYMRNPDTFHSVGASPPRGILLWGPPGSGKTLLARAIAGEAGRRTIGGAGPLGQGATIDYFTVCSGSDFVETYVGRGAARIRSLFRGVREEAWKSFERRRRDYKRQTSVNSTMWDGMHSLLTGSTNAADLEYCNRQRPMAIIFIDEIDALAKNRDSGGFSSSLGGCDEREQTLNQLLTEMDGFATGTATQHAVPDGPSSVIVIVIAATNRLSALDPAILRAGRFDRHVQVPLPDAKGREAILRIHARRIKCDHTSVNFHELAAGKIETVAPTHNFSGADLKNVINEAALLAVRTGSPCVKQEHLLDAVQKVKNVSKHSRKESHWFER